MSRKNLALPAFANQAYISYAGPTKKAPAFLYPLSVYVRPKATHISQISVGSAPFWAAAAAHIHRHIISISESFAQYIQTVYIACRRILRETEPYKLVTDGQATVVSIFAATGMIVAAIMRAGLVPFCISPRKAAAGVVDLLGGTGAAVLPVFDTLRFEELHDSSKELSESGTLPTLPTMMNLDSPGIIIHSSGSTSIYSKPIYLSHKRLLGTASIPWTGSEDHCGQIWAPGSAELANSQKRSGAVILTTHPNLIMSTAAAIESWSEDPVGLKVMQAAKAVSYIGTTLNKRVGNALVASGDGNWAVQSLMVLDVAAALPDTPSDDEDPAADELSLDLDKPKPKHGLGQLHISHLLEMVLEDAQTRLFFKVQSIIQSNLLVVFGLKYKSYCANVGRTFFVDPTPLISLKEQEAQYDFLLKLQQEMLTKIKPKISTRDFYHAALAFVKEKKPELEKNFMKNIGFGTGLEFRDSPYLLGPKTNRTLKENMTLSLGLRSADLVDSTGNKYCAALPCHYRIAYFSLADTPCNWSTRSKSSRTSPFSSPTALARSRTHRGAAEEEEAAPRRAARQQERSSVPAEEDRGGEGTAEPDKVHQTAAVKLAEHQRELHDALQAAGLERYSEGKEGKEGKGWKKFQSYKGEGGYLGRWRSCGKNDEAEFTYLRIDFRTPGQLAGKKEDTPFEDPEATFIRSIVFRSLDNHRFDSICKQITDLKKEANKREQQKKEMADIVDQGNLVELKNRRPAKMPEAFIRPAVDGKRLAGEVEIHQNGVRYLSPNGQKVAVRSQVLMIVHLHLKAPIMTGKKKTIQPTRSSTRHGIGKHKHRYGDEDEIEQEHHERKRRAMLNKEIEHLSMRG
ncbi:FACT complex subunit-domain-containing protein [Mycena olivaceomarginata]|nr:FACT complex subunit-domain-containing protein [Mycena olivaceomarginata]